MTSELLQLALGVNRVMTYVGYVLLAGTFTFWSLVWPQGRSDRRLVAFAVGGTGLLFLATLIGPGLVLLVGGRQAGDVLGPLTGAMLLLRLAALVAVAFWMVDIVRGDIVGRRRVFALSVVAVIAATLVTQSNAIGGRWEVVKILATSGHVLATAAWLGGLVALAAVLIPRGHVVELDRLIPRFSRVATLSVVVLVVTGILHALAVAGGVRPLLTSWYGLILLIKVGIFVAMLLLGNQGRRHAARVAFRRRHFPGEATSGTQLHELAVMMGAELAMAFVILATTSALVLVAPHP